MLSRLTAHLHELVFAMDRLADNAVRSRFGVDYNLFVFLNPLFERDLDVTLLAEQLNLTRAAVSKRVPQLVRDGWIVTSSDPANARRVLLALTARGRELVAEAGSLLGTRFGSIVDGLSIDAAHLDSDLVALIAAVRAVPDQSMSEAAELSGEQAHTGTRP